MDKYRTPKHVLEEHKRRQLENNRQRPNIEKVPISRRLDILLPDNKAISIKKKENDEIDRQDEGNKSQSFQFWMDSFDREAPLKFADVKPNFYISTQRSELELVIHFMTNIIETSQLINSEMLYNIRSYIIYASTIIILHQS